MPRRWTAPAVVALVACLTTLGSLGQEGRGTIRLQVDGEGGEAGRKWAVVIGVNEYIDPALPALRFCVADAELVAKRLVERCGYEADRVLVITDSQPKAHLRPLKRNIQVQAQAWLKRAGPKDTVLVFFAGHGFLDARGQGFLATQECERDNLGLTALRTDDLRDMLRQCKAAQKLLVLDCCHAGGDRGEGDAGASSEELGASFRGAEGLVTLASCKKDETSREWPAKGQGLFTYFLAEGLSGKADADRNGVVDSDELYQYCLEQVSLVGQRELNARQTPVRIIGEDVVGRFALARVGRGAGRRGGAITVVPVGEPVVHHDYVYTVEFSVNGKFGLSTSNGSTVLWDMTGERVTPRELPVDAPFGGAFSPDGRLLLTAGSPNARAAAQLWELPSGRPVDPPLEHGEAILSVAFSPDGRRLLTAGGHEVRLWDTASRRMLGPLVHHYNVRCAAFSPDGATVLTGSGITERIPEDEVINGMQGEARFWSVGTGKLIGEPLRLEHRVQTVGFGKGGRFFTGTSDTQVQLWRTGDGEPEGIPLNLGSGQFAAFSPDGTRIVTGGFGREARIRDLAATPPVVKSIPHVHPVLAVAFSPDGTMALTGSGTEKAGEAQLWDARTGQAVGSAMAHKGAVWCVAFSGDGRRIMTGGSDKTARLWEVRRGE